MEMLPVAKEILHRLSQDGCWYEAFEHEAVRTSAEAARTRPGYSLQQGAKAIVLRTKKSGGDQEFVMLVFPADLMFDKKKVKAILGVREIRFACVQWRCRPSHTV